VFVPEAPACEQLLGLVERLSAQVAELSARNAELKRIVTEQADRIAELERRLSADSSNSSRPPSADAPWDKPAKKRSSRGRSGRRPGKQSGAPSSSRSLVDDPDEVKEIEPEYCQRCNTSLVGAEERGRQRRQVIDVPPAPAPEVIEYQRVSRRCSCCGAVTTPGWDDTGDENAAVVAPGGSPVRIGPATIARAALLTCAHYLPVGRSRELPETLCGIDVSTGFLAGIRGRAARRLEQTFLPPPAHAAGQRGGATRR
jgi:transposase